MGLIYFGVKQSCLLTDTGGFRTKSAHFRERMGGKRVGDGSFHPATFVFVQIIAYIVG